jgi:peptidoglycan/xylan/chitin deacetylase (PgdA/CDA1 family)
MWPQSRLLGPNLTCLPEAAARRGCNALTFDDGPDPSVTPRVLDLLDEAKAVASFFCIGRAARAHPALVRDISRRGHSVENHTATHPYGFACYTPGRLRREIGEAQSILADITGSAPGFFRAPMGLRNPLLHLVLAETDLRFTSWTRRALDGALGSPDRALARLTRGLTAGDILLMHDGRCARAPSGREVVLEVLPAVLRAVMAAGLRPVSLPMACGEGGATAAAWLAGATAGP